MTDTRKIQNATLSGIRDVNVGGPATIDWFIGENLMDIVGKLQRELPIHCYLASELMRRAKEFNSVDADKPIRLATSAGTTVLMARDNPTCVYTFEATQPMWDYLMHAVSQKYFDGKLVLQQPNLPMRASFGDISFMNSIKAQAFGATYGMPDALIDDLNAQHPYIREGEDGSLTLTGADLNDLFSTLQLLNFPLYRILSDLQQEIVKAIPPSAPMILEFVPNRSTTISCLARRSDRYMAPRTFKG